MTETAHARMGGIGSERDADGPGPQVTDEAATRAAVDTVRELIDTLRVADAPAAALARAAALVEEATTVLRPHRVEAMRMQGALRPERMTRLAADHVDLEGAFPDQPADYFPYSPIIGALNPVAPPLPVSWDGERLRGTVSLGASYVGPPEMVHGGIIALIFDEALGATNLCAGLGGFTGTLTIRYELPTPLLTPIDLECWIDKVEGRKITTVGTISHDGQLTARAEGIFIRARS
jgi:acyl-coenzyme A thioesterase PaaI-like protein